ncbi:MAG: glutamate decarboxylase [Gammaproteobacteria bacterium]|nr:glutamate decarboxylase [Gammaproteobacteria bacterium]
MSIEKAKHEEICDLTVSNYGSHDFDHKTTKNKLPETGMPAQHAYNLVNDKLMLDGNARLNLATFVTTWMEPEATKLMSETFDKNMIDKDEYPQTAEIEAQCVSILSHLWNCHPKSTTIGCSTTGSSEACMLAGLAMKWRWRDRMKKIQKNYDKPNLVMGINVQVCWDKFCRYWDIEMRQAPMKPGKYTLQADEAIKLCDENTIGIVAILGSTFTGEYEPISEINAELEKLNSATNWNIPIHVDAASGGFVAPFLQPDYVWDFRLRWVKSINVSGHKYGLVYPGVGWAVWADTHDLPEDLIFNVNYLGGSMPTFALNFSRPGNQVIAQYYNFLRLGKSGYQRVHQVCQNVAKYLASEIAKFDIFELLSDGSHLPVLTWKLKKPTNFTLFNLSEHLHHDGWQIPAYTLPENLTDITIMRIVVRAGFSMDMANLLLENIRRVLKHFSEQEDIIQGDKKSSIHPYELLLMSKKIARNKKILDELAIRNYKLPPILIVDNDMSVQILAYNGNKWQITENGINWKNDIPDLIKQAWGNRSEQEDIISYLIRNKDDQEFMSLKAQHIHMHCPCCFSH